VAADGCLALTAQRCRLVGQRPVPGRDALGRAQEVGTIQRSDDPAATGIIDIGAACQEDLTLADAKGLGDHVLGYALRRLLDAKLAGGLPGTNEVIAAHVDSP